MDGALPILPNQISQPVASLYWRDLDAATFREACRAKCVKSLALENRNWKLFQYIYRASFIILYYGQQMHNYLTNTGQNDSDINIKIVYTANTQTDFMRIVATKRF